MNSKTYRILAFVVIATLLAACSAPAATQAPAANGASTSKWCSDVHIVFFPGGPQGGVFAVNVYNGAVQAQADLGPKVDYVWSDWDPQKMIQQFQESAATKPDGIAVMGHPGDQAFDPQIDAAEKNGIIVTSQNTTLDLVEAKYAANGLKTLPPVCRLEMKPLSASRWQKATGRWCGACFHSHPVACGPRA
jgi:simple sugar transport system substrate-binding protein